MVLNPKQHYVNEHKLTSFDHWKDLQLKDYVDWLQQSHEVTQKRWTAACLHLERIIPPNEAGVATNIRQLSTDTKGKAVSFLLR